MKNRSYTVFAKYYDLMMTEVPYDEWVAYLEMLITGKLKARPCQILDLACGTGNMTIRLAKKGYQMFGIDGSPEMIAVAEKKAQRAGVDINFTSGDFCSFQVSTPVDLVICLYDSLNYLLELEKLEQTFQQVYQALKPGGYFIFDLNTIQRLRNIKDGKRLFEGDGYYCFWTDKVDLEIPLWNIQLTFFLEQSNGCLERSDEFHVERGYPLTNIHHLLEDVGFQIVGLYDAFSLSPGSDQSERVYFVVQRLTKK